MSAEDSLGIGASWLQGLKRGGDAFQSYGARISGESFPHSADYECKIVADLLRKCVCSGIDAAFRW